jgi:hypothetical protein
VARLSPRLRKYTSSGNEGRSGSAYCSDRRRRHKGTPSFLPLYRTTRWCDSLLQS